MRHLLQRLVLVLFASGLLMSASPVEAQVTTATLVGQLRDSSGAVIPGATVVATHEGTGVARDAVTDVNGEFVLSALPSGPYTVKIEVTGFRTMENRGIQLGAGQTVRQTFALQVGTFAETVTVAVETPLIETSASVQADSLGSQEVRELPVNRRNLTNLMSLTPGVSTSGAGDVQMNGVAAGGTGVTVDGTEANSNPEARSLAQYGGQNQISVMSLDSIAEVQIVKGVLPAEYGGVAGGQINVISRSGTNAFHGFGVLQRPEPEIQRPQLLLLGGTAGRHVPSVRGHTRRAHRSQQGVLLRHLRGLPGERAAEPQHDGAVQGGPGRNSASAAIPRDEDRCWRSFRCRPSRSCRRRASSIRRSAGGAVSGPRNARRMPRSSRAKPRSSTAGALP